MKKFLSVALIILLPAFAVSASETSKTIQKSGDLIFVTEDIEIPEEELAQYFLPENLPAQRAPKMGLEEAGVILDIVINVGQRIWNIVSQGFHDPSFQTSRAHALPQGIDRNEVFHYLAGFQGPAVKRRQVTVYSKYISGRWVARATYDVIAYYGGNHNGQGSYLLDVHAKPVGEPEVRFSWDLDVEVSADEPFNMAATGESPMAALQLNVTYKAEAPHDSRSSVESFLIKGDGDIRVLTAAE